jgi:hypothetical protein
MCNLLFDKFLVAFSDNGRDAHIRMKPARQMGLMAGREAMSTHVAAKAVPFDGTPPSIPIPYLVLVECRDIRCVERYFCDGYKARSGSAS